MSEKETIAVNILDKEYLVASPEDARHELQQAARYLDQKMREIRASGKVFGTERIAVMAALNLSHELIRKGELPDSAASVLADMDRKLTAALSDDTV